MNESNHTPWPRARFAHSMVTYKNRLYIFGGAGPYIRQIKMRLGLNDLWIYDLALDKWIQAPVEGSP